MRRGILLLLAGTAAAVASGCARKKTTQAVAAGARPDGAPDLAGSPAPRPPTPRPPRPVLAPLAAGEVYVYDDRATTAVKMSDVEAQAAGLLVVELGDSWAPFIFQDGGGAPKDDAPKPNGYRRTFVALANDRIDADGNKPRRGEHNFLEPFGIPPSLSVLRSRATHDGSVPRQACEAGVDRDGLRAFTGNIGYLGRERARRDYVQARRDGDWLQGEITPREAALAARVPTADGGVDAAATTATAAASAVVTAAASTAAAPAAAPAAKVATWQPGDRAAALAALRADPDPKLRARVDRAVRGQDRLRAVRATQARLICEGLLSSRSRFTAGMFDLPTHEALAEWERKNDIFGWAFLGGDTLAALLRPARELDFDAFRRVLAERVADAAGIIEDGSTSRGKRPASYVDDQSGAGGRDATPATPATQDTIAATDGTDATDDDAPPSEGQGGGRRVPNLIGDHLAALLAALHIGNADDMMDFLHQHGDTGLGTLRVGFHPPPLPPYYEAPAGGRMDLSVEIDRGDVWYDFPFDARGRLLEQQRSHFPHLTLFVNWRGQKIPLVRWRTTIGSWRSEMHANGKVYYKYKNSDVGPRVWKHIVAGPVWIPPDATPAKDLLTRKVLDRNKGPELVVNTDVMGPGFQSAYGLAMAIHINKSGFDNQIRTHGSVDYTSIARRFSHGCHRLVNNRAVRLFDFVLRRQPFRRVGSMPLHLKRKLVVAEKNYTFELKTRGYYYELEQPIAVTVREGRIRGQVKRPIVAYIRKAGVDYSDIAPGDDIPAVDTPGGETAKADAMTPDTAKADTPKEDIRTAETKTRGTQAARKTTATPASTWKLRPRQGQTPGARAATRP